MPNQLCARNHFLLVGRFHIDLIVLNFFCEDYGEICCPLVELTKWICTKASFAT